MGWHTFYMPGSYVAFLEDPDVAHARQMNQRARIQLRKLVCRINACQPLDPVRVGLLDRFMSMACIHQCPKAAVEFRRITIGKNRYYNTGE